VFSLDGIDPGSLERYKDLMGFRHAAVPVTFFYLIAQRAHLATMLTRDFPFRIPGMIHVANELAGHAAMDPRARLTVTTDLDIAPPDDKGAVYCVLRTVGEQDTGVVFSCTSTYLAQRGQGGKGAARAREPQAALPPMAGWRVQPSTGRGYARVSGDWNPIHLWSWSARMMGLKAPIIHGMHTLGKACAALEEATGHRVVSISARFRAPIGLGAQASLGADTADGSFQVTCNGRSAVTGRFALA
jgi:acyl dehydratase